MSIMLISAYNLAYMGLSTEGLDYKGIKSDTMRIAGTFLPPMFQSSDIKKHV